MIQQLLLSGIGLSKQFDCKAQAFSTRSTPRTTIKTQSVFPSTEPHNWSLADDRHSVPCNVVVDPNLLRGGQIGATSAWGYHHPLPGFPTLLMTRKTCFLVSDRLSRLDSVEVTIMRKFEVGFRHAQKQMAA